MRRLGVLLVVMAIVGFLTVADDLRHKGELFAVGSILVCGLVLVALSARKGPGAGPLCLAALLVVPGGGGAAPGRWRRTSSIFTGGSCRSRVGRP